MRTAPAPIALAALRAASSSSSTPRTRAPAAAHGARSRPDPQVGSRTETLLGPSVGEQRAEQLVQQLGEPERGEVLGVLALVVLPERQGVVRLAARVGGAVQGGGVGHGGPSFRGRGRGGRRLAGAGPGQPRGLTRWIGCLDVVTGGHGTASPLARRRNSRRYAWSALHDGRDSGAEHWLLRLHAAAHDRDADRFAASVEGSDPVGASEQGDALGPRLASLGEPDRDGLGVHGVT